MDRLISNIVFTKNRPLQLEAYLESLYRHLPRDLIQTYILYKSDLFDEQYSQLFRRFSDCAVIREQNFRRDFLSLLEKIDTKYILFGTDDVVYYDMVSFAVIDDVFDKFSDKIFGFSLRLSPESLQERSDDVISEIMAGGQKVYRLNWKHGWSQNAKYPFELDSTIYTTALVKKIVWHVSRERPLFKKLFAKNSPRVRFLSHIISMKNFLTSLEVFHDPNTLEGYCYRWCKTHKWRLPGYLYLQKFCASAIQINRVNTTTDNPIDGLYEHTVEALNEKYKQGYRFDIDSIEKDKPNASHVGKRFFKLVKDAI